LRSAGTCVFPCRTATWRNCWPSGACTPITSRCGDGSNVTPRKWNDVCARDSNRPQTVGVWMRPTSGSRASGATCIARWIVPARPSTFSSQPGRTRPQQSASRAKALGRKNHPTPRVINTDGHSAYPPAIVRLKAEGVLEKDCRHRPVPYLNNVLEQDHRAIKRRVNASQHFRSFWAAWRTIAGYETIHMLRKGQACGSALGGRAVPLHRFMLGLFSAVAG
jgi:DDE superfamily endonuclease